MLVLTRKRSETIRIGNDILVKVIRTGRSTVKIGIEAPADVRVVRGELATFDGDQKPEADGNSLLEVSPSAIRPGAMVAACSDQFPHPHIV